MTAQLTLSPCWSRLITGAQELLNVFPFQWCCCLTLQGELQTELITRFVRLHSLLTRRNISKAPFSPLWPAGLFFPSWETCHSLYLIESKMLLLYTPPCLSLWAALENSQARSPVQFRNMLDVVFSNMGLPLAVEAQHTFLCYSRLWAAINPLAIFSWKKKKKSELLYNCCYSFHSSHSREAEAWMSLLSSAVISKYAKNYFYFSPFFFHYYY